MRYIYDYNKGPKNIISVNQEGGFDHQPPETPQARTTLPRTCKVMHGEEVVVGSLDVKSLYTMCKSRTMGEHIRTFFKQSKLRYEGVNCKSLVRYLALTHMRTNTQLDDFIPPPKGTTTMKSWLTTETDHQFNEAVVEGCLANQEETNQLLGHCITNCLDIAMKNHYYTVGGNIYRQKDGSAMGVDASVEGCDLYMLAWDRLFLRKLLDLGWTLMLYKRYVDDIGAASMMLNPGWHYDAVKDKMVFSGTHQNHNIPGDQRTFLEMVAIGNTLDPNIQLEMDVPSLNGDNKLPLLDIKIWMEGDTLRHQFYKKDLSSKYLILQRSAMAQKVKRNTLFEEGIRRLRNCDLETDRDKLIEVLGEFSNAMRISGYSLQVRHDIVRGVLERSKQMEELIRAGSKIRYRNFKEMETQKSSRYGKHKNTWFLRGEVTSILKVQVTPRGHLASITREILRGLRAPDGGLTSVVETGGRNVMSGLAKGDPFRGQECPFNGGVTHIKCWSVPKADC